MERTRGLDRAFFCNSGGEANEAAIKSPLETRRARVFTQFYKKIEPGVSARRPRASRRALWSLFSFFSRVRETRLPPPLRRRRRRRRESIEKKVGEELSRCKTRIVSSFSTGSRSSATRWRTRAARARRLSEPLEKVGVSEPNEAPSGVLLGEALRTRETQRGRDETRERERERERDAGAKPVVLTAYGSFHGRTIATISATAQPKSAALVSAFSSQKVRASFFSVAENEEPVEHENVALSGTTDRTAAGTWRTCSTTSSTTTPFHYFQKASF